MGLLFAFPRSEKYQESVKTDVEDKKSACEADIVVCLIFFSIRYDEVWSPIISGQGKRNDLQKALDADKVDFKALDATVCFGF